ncbi:Fructosidase [Operophtera brumata]|uniref:Sucrose-6-phosphate hydrolase n=1 Tax=Operophtera brumata TaxID=104452 RepID=A0A0L7LIT1_OPEBR|nr:Fructosidase [Operophtera brumata]
MGWMNDPNGFCIYEEYYHLFYQYNPESSLVPGIAHWGHARSKDLFNWEHLPIALYPDQWYDKSGVFSGSALVEDDVMSIFYTGNVNHPGENPDHEQHQILATSSDGVTFTKSKIVINGSEYQPNFRDPKVWKHLDTYYMVLGNSFENNTLGRVLLYASKDKITWEVKSVLDASNGSLGYMWECPDFFPMDGYYVLMFSPQGIEPQGDRYRNLYQAGYIVGEFDCECHTFTPIQPFRELDHGHDFYATQTIIDKNDERVVIAWMDMWDENYPEGPDGSTGQMTIPRTLRMTRDGRLLQHPVKEIVSAVGLELYSGKARGGTKIKLDKNAGKVEVHSSNRKNFSLVIESEGGNDTVTISYDCRNGRVTLDRGGVDGVRRTEYRPLCEFYMVVYIDSSSIEVFFGNGEVTMSSRFFPQGPLTVGVAEDSNARVMLVNDMKRTVPLPNP